MHRAAGLWHAIWERAAEPPVTTDLLRAMTHAGNYLSGAWRERTMVGALFGFFGGRDRPDHLHSHILGVDPTARARGVGYALKLHQRAWALERGIDTITWTFDPLVRANGYFNVGRLGAVGAEYLVDFYGAMPDAINRGEASDRVLVRWALDSPRVAGALDRDRAPVQLDDAVLALEVGPDQGPKAHADATLAAVLRCQVPADIIALRRQQPELARDWRLAVRAVLVPAFQRGLSVTGMDRAGWYLVR